MGKGFLRDSQGSLYYKSKYEYSLLNGITDKGYTSDIMFIFREPTGNDIENGFTGEVVSFLYGGFENLKDVEQIILDYEKEN